MINEDFTLASMESRFRAEVGRPLTPEESKKVKEQHKRIEDAQKVSDAKQEQMIQEVEDSDVDTVVKLVERKIRSRKTKVKRQKIYDRGTERIDRGKAKLKSLGLLHPSNPIFNPELHGALIDIGVGLMQHGYVNSADFISEFRGMFDERSNRAMSDDDIKGLYGEVYAEYEKDLENLEGASKEEIEEAIEELIFETETLLEAGEPIDHRTVYRLADLFAMSGLRS